MKIDENYDKWMHWIETIEREATLNEWEENFVESVKSQLQRKGILSRAQADRLEQIYAEKTS